MSAKNSTVQDKAADHIGSSSWSDRFVGRGEELDQLSKAWERVKRNEGPEFAVLLGEPGLGKTRIAQEFYCHLATQQDKISDSPYWPSTLRVDGRESAINPSASSCSDQAEMSYLWWGIRAPERGRRNDCLSSSLPGALHAFAPHLRQVEINREKRELQAERSSIVGSSVSDAALAVIDFFTGNVLGVAKSATAATQKYRAISKQIQSSITPGLQQVEEERQVTIIDGAITLVQEAVRLHHGRHAHTPLVLLMDDAQFLNEDPITREFTTTLMRHALRSNLPILFLLTYWDMEWHADLECQASGIPRLVESSTSANWAPINVCPTPAVDSILAYALPGLTDDVKSQICTRVDGNPQLMHQVIETLKDKPSLFYGQSTTNSLTRDGLSAFLSQTFDAHSMARNRMKGRTESSQLALAAASLQGMRFHTALVAETLQELGCDQECLAECMEHLTGYECHTCEDTEFSRAFSQTLYFDVAEQVMADKFSVSEARRALSHSVLRMLRALSPAKSGDAEETLFVANIGLGLLKSHEGYFEESEDAATVYSAGTQAALVIHDTLSAAAYAKETVCALKRGSICVSQLDPLTLSGQIQAARAAGYTPDALDLSNYAEGHVASSPMSRRSQVKLLIQISRVKSDLSQLVAAERTAAIALEMCRVIQDNSNEQDAILLIEALLEIAHISAKRDNVASASKQIFEALDIARRLANVTSSVDSLRQLRDAVDWAAYCDRALLGSASAASTAAEALSLARQVADLEGSPSSRRRVVKCLLHCAYIKQNEQDGDVLYAQAVDSARSLYQDFRTPSAALALTEALLWSARRDFANDIFESGSEQIKEAAAYFSDGILASISSGAAHQHLDVLETAASNEVAISNRSGREAWEYLIEAARNYVEIYGGADTKLLLHRVLVASASNHGYTVSKADDLKNEAAALLRTLIRDTSNLSLKAEALSSFLLSSRETPHTGIEKPRQISEAVEYGDAADPFKGVVCSEPPATLLDGLLEILGAKPEGLHLQVKYARLPFLKDSHLVRIEWAGSDVPEGLYSDVVVTPVVCVPVHSESQRVHALGKAQDFALNDNTIKSYMRFFCEYVHGDEGPFSIISSYRDIPAKDSIADIESSVLQRLDIKDLCIRRSQDESHDWSAIATILYKDWLFRASFTMRGNTTEMSMTEDTPLRGGLPVDHKAVRRELHWDLLIGWPSHDLINRHKYACSKLREAATDLLGMQDIAGCSDEELAARMQRRAEGGDGKAMAVIGRSVDYDYWPLDQAFDAKHWYQKAFEAGEHSCIAHAINKAAHELIDGRGDLQELDSLIANADSTEVAELDGFDRALLANCTIWLAASTGGLTWQSHIGEAIEMIRLSRSQEPLPLVLRLERYFTLDFEDVEGGATEAFLKRFSAFLEMENPRLLHAAIVMLYYRCGAKSREETIVQGAPNEDVQLAIDQLVNAGVIGESGE